MAVDPRRELDWGRIAPLRLTARKVADGVYAGAHRSARRGAGVEFGSHRDYVPGDDLRWLDRHALMRHGRLVVRQFETETDRTLRLVLDATASMGFKSEQGSAAKLAFAALLAAALARIAAATGDRVGLDFVAGSDCRRLPATGGSEAFDRIVEALQGARASGQVDPELRVLEQALLPVMRNTRRGSIIVFFSDLLDLPDGAAGQLANLTTGGRTVIAVRILDPLEAEFGLQGPVRLRASESDLLIETDASAARAGYLDALARVEERFGDQLIVRGGRLVRSVTTDDPVAALQRVLFASGGRTW